MVAHKAGFVNIIGRPNVGKSTLMNNLVSERLAIITSKAQTTRQRILGIVNGADFQIVYSDTPGMIIQPQYELHRKMMRFVATALEDADIVLFMTDIFEKSDRDPALIRGLKKTKAPILLLINKIDMGTEAQVKRQEEFWRKQLNVHKIIPVSALKGTNLHLVFDTLLELLPQHPPYFPKDALTDKPERFFVAESIREKIFLNFQQEVPYSTEIVTEAFQEEEAIIRIMADIYVERETQKRIIIGKGGQAIKKVGIEARQDLEQFFQKKIYLELHVKVREKWRNDPKWLKSFGYR